MLTCRRIILCLFFIFTAVVNGFSQNYVFAQLTGNPINTTGWNMQGAARVQNILFSNNSEINVCPLGGASGAIFYNQPINLSLCKKWKAEFDFRMYDGNGADGLAFCFLDVPPSGFVSGAGLGIPATANGLKICFDTWNNCITFNAGTVHKDMPKIEIRYGTGYDECSGMPTRDNADNAIAFVADAKYKHAKITYDDGKIDVYVNDVLYISGNQKFEYKGYLGFTASTGGYYDNHSIRNVAIYTEMPPSEAGAALPACPNAAMQLGANGNADYLYSWTPATGLSDANIPNPVLRLDNKTSVTQKLIYQVRTSFKENPGCTSTDSVEVKILPRPQVNFLMPDICLNDATASFTDSSWSGEPSLLPLTYQWRFGDPNANASNPNTSLLKNGLHKYSAAANYNVQLQVTNSAGCIDSLQKIFTVNGAVPKAGFNVLNAAFLCSNIPVQIQDASSVDFGKITKVIIDWGDTKTDTDDAPSAGEKYAHAYAANLSAKPKVYTIRYTAYSGITCVDAIAKSISVNAVPQVKFSAIPSLCANDNVYQLKEATEQTGITGSFLYAGNPVDAAGLINPVSNEGIYTIQARFTAANGCIDSASSSLSIYPFPTVDAGPNLYVLQNGNITIQATASVSNGSLMQYNWSPATFLNNALLLNPVATPPADILYTLTVTSQGNCKNGDTVRITVLKNPTIPSAFSPNGDGINDVWNIRYLDTYPGCVVQVFDRFGRQVYQSTGYPNPWNGTVGSKPLPIGVYYYIVNTKKHDKPFTGSVTILR